MAGGREIDDGEAPVGERDAGLRVAPDAMIVGAAISETVGHRDGVALELLARAGR